MANPKKSWAIIRPKHELESESKERVNWWTDPSDPDGYKIQEKDLVSWKKVIDGTHVRKQAKGTQTPAQKAELDSKFEAVKAWLVANPPPKDHLKNPSTKRALIEDEEKKHDNDVGDYGGPIESVRKKSKKAEMAYDDPKQNAVQPVDDDDDSSDPEWEPWMGHNPKPQANAPASAASNPFAAPENTNTYSALLRPTVNDYLVRQGKRKAKEFKDNEFEQNAAAEYKRLSGLAAQPSSGELMEINGETHFRKAKDLAKGQGGRWKWVLKPDLTIIKKIYAPFKTYAAKKNPKHTEALRLRKLLELCKANSASMNREMFANPVTDGTAQTHFFSPTVLACIFLDGAFPNTLSNVMKSDWNGQCMADPRINTGYSFKRHSAMDMLIYLACHLSYWDELDDSNGARESELNWSKLTAANRLNFNPLGPREVNKVGVLEDVVEVVELMTWNGQHARTLALNKFKLNMQLVFHSKHFDLYRDTYNGKHPVRVKKFLLNKYIFAMSTTANNAKLAAESKTMAFNQMNLTMFYKSDIVGFIAELQNYIRNGTNLLKERLPAQILLVQLMTGCRINEVIQTSDFYGNEEYFNTDGLSPVKRFETTKQDPQIVVAGISKQKKANAGELVRQEEADFDDDVDPALGDVDGINFKKIRVQTEQIKVLPAKPILFPEKFKAYDIITMVNAVRRIISDKQLPYKQVYTFCNKLWKSTALVKSYGGKLKGHKLRSIYAVYSYDLYASFSSKQMSLNAWINQVLGHSVNNLRTSLNYNTSAIKEDLFKELKKEVKSQLIKTSQLEFGLQLAEALLKINATWEDHGDDLVDQMHNQINSTTFKQNLGGLDDDLEDLPKQFVRIPLPKLKNKTFEQRKPFIRRWAEKLKENRVSDSFAHLRQLGFNNKDIKSFKDEDGSNSDGDIDLPEQDPEDLNWEVDPSDFVDPY